MELMLILRVLLRRWWLVLIPTVVVAALVAPELLRSRGGGGYTVTVRYSAAQVLQAVPVTRDGDYQDIWLASELTINALTDWVRSGSFINEIAARLKDIDPSKIAVAADNKRSLGQLTLSYPDEAGLKAITAAALDILKTRSQNYFPQLGGQPAQVTILDVPTVVPAPPPITNRLAPVVKVLLGLLAGIGLAFLWEYLDPTLRRREQVEALGLPVVSSLPRE
jgi:capsular polysaccharide biosynthesis protein